MAWEILDWTGLRLRQTRNREEIWEQWGQPRPGDDLPGERHGQALFSLIESTGWRTGSCHRHAVQGHHLQVAARVGLYHWSRSSEILCSHWLDLLNAFGTKFNDLKPRVHHSEGDKHCSWLQERLHENLMVGLENPRKNISSPYRVHTNQSSGY